MKNPEQRQSEIIYKLIGAWALMTWCETTATGEVRYPLGKDAIGQLIYTSDLRVSAQLASQSQPNFQSEDWREATQPESAQAWKQYFGYFGTFSLDLDRQAVIHHIEGSWFPNLRGTDQVRFFRFEQERLMLEADTEWGRVHIVWQRAHANSIASR
jgi:hypothetical protein